MMGRLWVWVAGKATGAWIWIAGGLAAMAFLASLYASIFKNGRRAQQVESLQEEARRNRAATQARIEAMKPVTPQEEANDPFNRDRR